MVSSNLLSQLETLLTGQKYNQTSRACPTFHLLQPDLCGVLRPVCRSGVAINHLQQLQCSSVAMTWTSYSLGAKSSTTQLTKHRSVALPASPMNSLSSCVMIEALICTGLVGAHCTYTNHQAQQLQVSLHLLFIHYKLKVYTYSSHLHLASVHYCSGATTSVRVTCHVSCCQL